MTNAQHGVMSGVKHRLKLISDPNISEADKAGYRDWILDVLESNIHELNKYRLGCTCE